MYVAGALEFERPFRGPLYKFFTLHSRLPVRRVAPYVKFMFSYLADQLALSRHFTCSTVLQLAGVRSTCGRAGQQLQNGHRGFVSSPVDFSLGLDGYREVQLALDLRPRRHDFLGDVPF